MSNIKTAVDFSTASNLFHKYPSGKCVYHLDDEALDLTVVSFIESNDFREHNFQGGYYVVHVPATTNQSVFSAHGFALVPFREEDYPGLLWEFIRPDGTAVKFKEVIKLVADTSPHFNDPLTREI